MTSALLALAVAAASGGTPRAPGAAITAAELQRHIRYLASDALEGRAPGTDGDRLAEEYIAREFAALGLSPGAPGGGYVQPVELIGVTGSPETIDLAGTEGRALQLRRGDEFIAAAGTPKPEARIDAAEVVFVGYGIVAPEFGWDDYKGMDLRGKVLLMMNNDPEDDPAIFGGKARLWYGRWDYKFEQAARVGAAGAILIHTNASAGYPWSVVQTSWSGEQLQLPERSAPRPDVDLWVTEDAARRLVALSGNELDLLRREAQRRDFRPFPLGVRLSTRFASAVRPRRTGNVIAVLPGSSPALSSQAVFLTAHHDHLGRNPNARPGEDAIYNGAVDNASGVAQLLAVAKALAALPARPKRSIYFAATAAEEQGLLGSDYLVHHPPVPVEQIAADLNLDGINIWGPTRDVTVIGYGKSTLDAVVARAAAKQGRVVTPDLLPDRGFFYRSDQFQFARAGVPSVYAQSGMEVRGKPPGWGRKQKQAWESTHYHQPCDEFDPRWNLAGAVQDGQLYLDVARELADAGELPAWTPGDEFEQVRRPRAGSAQASGGAAQAP